MRPRHAGPLFGIALCLPLVAAAGGTEALATEGTGAQLDEIKAGFYSRLNAQAFGVVQQPNDTRLNPMNRLNFPRYQAEVDLRPDFNLDVRRWQLGVKPRFQFLWERWEDGALAGEDDTSETFFINEWFARYRVSDELFASYGRENLQWGPSYLLSPSNPFNPFNGRNNPRVEVPGLDYGRVLWIPDDNWSLSFIANTDEGHLRQFRDFEKAYAVKLDYTGEGKYLSLIPSYREHDVFRLGMFGGWNASDALLIYGESSVSENTEEFQLLGGVAYTLESGPSIALEYYHSHGGCERDRLDLCFSLREVDPDDPLFRENYLLLQYIDTDTWEDLSLTFRAIPNIDDGSSRLIGIVEYDVGQHAQLFLVATGNTGHGDTEFNGFVRYSMFMGIGYTL